ncbi:MAG: hypothetical protein PHS31_01870 [Victivallaceae bacterium]|nr:hypothetical protein [Victivallaceae bacterium]MDD4180561.1 hypothetical protein [Victivallaceae bacterium]
MFEVYGGTGKNREATIALVHEGLGYKLKMDHYPWSAEWLLQLRERINRALAG